MQAAKKDLRGEACEWMEGWSMEASDYRALNASLQYSVIPVTPIFLRSDEGTSRVFEALARAGDEKHTRRVALKL